ncbi:EpsI protein [Desulfovibrio sp. DV]|uniref:exosortase C-terminal domain/associated protein EpsI n=1 Tax=Desulfovibrio sp. DV TaxID=1844708 RepID=UPI00094BAF16|nr:exosortase C-terminal domain/associated protein EpsI [Desulfovibrio sp. DV]OLN29436.1 EpsI protein [Desulfovibrio sp. DV]
MIPWSRFVILAMVFLSAAACVGLRRDTPAPLARPLSQFPTTLGHWRMIAQEHFTPETVAFLRPTDYLARRYEGPNGERIDIYIGYHDAAQASGPVHSPKNCLPGSGWIELSTSQRSVKLAGKEEQVAQALYGKAEEELLFLYWFVVRDSILSSEIGLKVAEVANALRHGQRSAAFVRISLPARNNPAAAVAAATDFLNAGSDAIAEFLRPKGA